MSDADVDRYHQRAAEALQYATKALNPQVKEMWLGLAEEWLRLAQSRSADR
jgi:hypothetical protein